MRLTLRDNLSKAKPMLSAVVETVFPARCVSCHASTGAHGAMCSSCWAAIHFITDPMCFRCGLPFGHQMGEQALCGSCMQKSPAFTEARAVFRYDENSRSQILSLKYHDKTHLAPVFGQWLARLASPYSGRLNAIVPVPLHYWRLLGRRYNQAALLARALSRETGLAVMADALVRVRATKTQAGLSRAGREDNVRGAFRAARKHKRALKGLSVLLIDDVMTTGATLNACARALHDAGVKDVYVLTLARTVVGD